MSAAIDSIQVTPYQCNALARPILKEMTQELTSPDDEDVDAPQEEDVEEHE
jgi:hypothetical protein